ncbi:MAG TPA: AIR synthase-related protein, partial [Bacteroidales bacterium]
MVSDDDLAEAKRLMKLLNKSGAEVMKKHNIRGATDITGFGLAGHALKMAKASRVSLKINMKDVPLIGNSYKLIDEGCIPGASFRNLDYAEKDIDFASDLDYNLKMIAFDAQTSGGLLFSVSPDKMNQILKELHSAGLRNSNVIGSVTDPKVKYIYLNN